MSNFRNRSPEEIIQAYLDRLTESFKRNSKQSTLVALIAVVSLWALSGITIVQAYEEAIMFTFGRVARNVGPGPNWHWPAPIGYIKKVPVTRIQKMEIGFRTIDVGPPARYQSVPNEALMLTGDENIVHLEFIVQYKISDPVAFLTEIVEPVDALRDASEASMREVIGKTPIDLALTEGKSNIQRQAEELLQEHMNNYKSGIKILTVKLQDVVPPDQVNDAFKDVINAKQDKERKINEAKGFQNDLIPEARGEAAQMLNQAEAYRISRVTEAEGTAERFKALLREYRKGRQVTKTRLYLETMEEILPKLEKTILPDAVSKSTLPYLPVGKK